MILCPPRDWADIDGFTWETFGSMILIKQMTNASSKDKEKAENSCEETET